MQDAPNAQVRCRHLAQFQALRNANCTTTVSCSRSELKGVSGHRLDDRPPPAHTAMSCRQGFGKLQATATLGSEVVIILVGASKPCGVQDATKTRAKRQDLRGGIAIFSQVQNLRKSSEHGPHCLDRPPQVLMVNGKERRLMMLHWVRPLLALCMKDDMATLFARHEPTVQPTSKLSNTELRFKSRS